MSKFLVALTALALAACGGTAEQQEAQQPPDAAAMSGAFSLADLAGTWNMKSLTPSGDSTLLTYTMTATADPSGWTLNFPGRDPIPMQVSVDGDSVIFDGGPYPSALRPDSAMVTVHGVSRMQNDTLVGTYTAHYATTGPDSVAMGRLEGTRVP